MEYNLADPPKLKQGTLVTADVPHIGRVPCLIVGKATADDVPFPQYIVECTDDTFPSVVYPYTTFVFPLGQLEYREIS